MHFQFLLLLFLLISSFSQAQDKAVVRRNYRLKKAPKFEIPLRVQFGEGCLITCEGIDQVPGLNRSLKTIPLDLIRGDTLILEVVNYMRPGCTSLILKINGQKPMVSGPGLCEEAFGWAQKFRFQTTHHLLRRGRLVIQKSPSSAPVRTIQKLKVFGHDRTYLLWGNRKEDFYYHTSVISLFTPDNW